MPTVLLWNVQRKALDELVLRLVQAHDIGLLVLVEYDGGVSALPELLKGQRFRQAPSFSRFGVFAQAPLSLERVSVRLPGDRADFWRVLDPHGTDGLLAAVHGPDRRNTNDATRKLVFGRIAREVERLEDHFGNQRTVIVGDFNAHPFESAVVDADGLHALGVRTLAGQAYRTVASEVRPFFYNPMWRLYGHGPDAGSATHYYPGTGSSEFVWHMLDQVLVRPSDPWLVPETEVRILRTAGAKPLVRADGRPDEVKGSDHLPILFPWHLAPPEGRL